MTSTMTSKGQVTVPKRLRDYLGLEPGAEVEFELRPEGDVVVRPARRGHARQRRPGRFAKLRGTLKTGMTTDELMRLLRGYDEDAKDPGLY
jgi:AbrB family looped-hinge helix DNA binding protein